MAVGGSARAAPPRSAGRGGQPSRRSRLVGAEAGVAARAGEHARPAPARPRAADRERLRELEQLVRGRPHHAAPASSRAHGRRVVAGHRAGVRRGGGGAHRGRADLQHHDPDARVRARGERLAEAGAVAVVLDSSATKRRPPARRPGARGGRASSSTAGCRSRSLCATAARPARARDARLPLCDPSATWPGSAATGRRPTAPRGCADATRPSPFGPQTGSAWRVPRRARARLGGRRSRRPRAKPAAKTRTPPHPSAARRAQPGRRGRRPGSRRRRRRAHRARPRATRSSGSRAPRTGRVHPRGLPVEPDRARG